MSKKPIPKTATEVTLEYFGESGQRIQYWANKIALEAYERGAEEMKENIVNILVSRGYLKTPSYIKPYSGERGHGSCCYCQSCHFAHEDCVCLHNELFNAITSLPLREEK